MLENCYKSMFTIGKTMKSILFLEDFVQDCGFATSYNPEKKNISLWLFWANSLLKTDLSGR